MENYSCRCGRLDCFGYNKTVRGCGILNNTDFNGRSCPFFKQKNEVEKDRKLHGKRGERADGQT